MKMARVSSPTSRPPPPPPPSLPRVLSSARDPLLSLLPLRDVLSLLATTSALRCDSDLLSFLLLHNPMASHLFQRCPLDWCRSPPSFTWSNSYACDVSDHDESRLPDEVVVTRGASLLSLAALVQHRLGAELCQAMEGYVNTTVSVPFILPLAVDASSTVDTSSLQAALDAVQSGLGETVLQPKPFVSEAGLHWDNLAATGCAFCEAASLTEEFERECRAHWETREADLTRISDECGDERLFLELKRAVEARMQKEDAYYKEALLDESSTEIAAHLLANGRFPKLRLMEPMSDHVQLCVGQAVSDGYIKQLCPRVYRPLRQLFDTNGFTHVRRVKTTLFKGSDELPRSEIASVQMVGGVAPHGFFAGVYLVEMFV